jgi:hypothetical protein
MCLGSSLQFGKQKEEVRRNKAWQCERTIGSIRAYFIIAGLLSGYINYIDFSAGTALKATILIVVSGVGLLISLGFLVIGVILPRVLGNGALLTKMLIGVNCVYLIGLIARS